MLGALPDGAEQQAWSSQPKQAICSFGISGEMVYRWGLEEFPIKTQWEESTADGYEIIVKGLNVLAKRRKNKEKAAEEGSVYNR